MRNILLATLMSVMVALDAGATLRESLDSLLSATYPDASAPGYSIVIVKGDDTVYNRQWGIADMERLTPVTAETKFNIASVSKQFASAAVLQLYGRGIVDIDVPISTYFPEFRSGIWQCVTPRMMMSHSSGVPDARPRTDRRWTIYANDYESVLYMQSLDTLKFEPGTAYDYINPTYTLMGRLVERVSGEEFEAYQRSHIFAPAGMSHAVYFSPGCETPEFAHGYINVDTGSAGESDNGLAHEYDSEGMTVYRDRSGHRWEECDYGEETFFATRPDGGIYTTAADLIAWERALQRGSIIAPSLVEMARTSHVTVTGSPWCSYQNRADTYYGLGWFIDRAPGRETKIYHTGDNGGFQAYLASYPESRVIVAMIENRNDIDRWPLQLKIESLLSRYGLIKE